MPEQHEFQKRQYNLIALLKHLTSTLIIITIYAAEHHLHLAQAGASSTPKNLVNNPHVTSETLNQTRTSSSQFQNEYQFRQTGSKPVTSLSDRHKSTPPSPDASFDHASTDFGTSGSSDYSYFDTRVMTNVPDCRGRIKLNGTRGFITDGPGYYQTNLQCIWLIDSGSDKATIRIQLHQFNTECNYDFLYIFDGDSVFAPLVAALSGDMKDFSNAFSEARSEESISSSDSEAEFIQPTNQPVEGITTSPTGLDISNRNSAITQSTPSESHTLELKTHSGKAFIYFHSDTAQSMPGFYMTYTIDSCPLDCSNRGECDYKISTCKCNPGFYGEGCQYILCPNNCTSPAHGICDKDQSCLCKKDYTGGDCSKRAYSQVWRRLTDTEGLNFPRAFHQSVIANDKLWIFGGKSRTLSNTNQGIFNHRKTPTILAFDLVSRRWLDHKFEGTTGQDHLAELSGHSVVALGNKVFIYGGMSMNNSILNTLSVFDVETHHLSIIPNQKSTKGSEEEFMAPLSVTGHTANLIDGHMYVFMGYNPIYGYLNFVQKFNIANNSWSILERRGRSISGFIGHSSTFDPINQLVYVYGGHNARRSNKLYTFDPHTEIWTNLLSGPSPRYYHSAVIMNGLLMIMGGNSYNISHQSDQCFQQSHLIYDLNCARSKPPGNSSTEVVSCGQKCWSSIDDTTSILKRHGHSLVARANEIILYGGFNGILMNDLRSLSIPPCSNYSDEAECNKPKFALKCEWNILNLSCDPKSYGGDVSQADCSKSDIRNLQAACWQAKSCSDCLNTNFGCVWCGLISQCQHNKCKAADSRTISNVSQCLIDDVTEAASMRNASDLQKYEVALTASELDNEMDCKLDNCYLCQSISQCSWLNDGCTHSPPNIIASKPFPMTPHEELTSDNQVSVVKTPNTKSSKRLMVLGFDPDDRSPYHTLLLNTSPYQTCDMPCFLRRSCNECTTTKCIWCSTTEQCIDSSAYFAYHAMGQCMHYVAHMLKCPVSTCTDIETCDKCLANPKCGWLNDISNTGKGRCIEGNSSGPSFGGPLASNLETNVTETSISTSVLTNWYYTNCPPCQCNGHSYCRANSSLCVQPCHDDTEGPHCDRCIPGYYGDPVNGGSCRPCRCNGHAHSCNRETGKCYCSTKGISGHNCNRCDEKNYYIGDPSSPGNGTCYYNLTTDYQYTFNMSKPEDHFYSDINFINVPLRKDSDVDFSIACSRLALVNITSGTSYKTRRPIHTGLECGSFRLRFPFDRHALSEGNFSFFVQVYRFQTPFILQIAFSQHRTLYLPQFFFTFSCLFLFFFALSGLAFKLKQEYDNYVRRQRQFIEMEQMASRPFSTVLLEMFRPSATHKTDELPNQKQQAEPTPISFEPCFGSNVGVLSVFVQLPGKPNLAIGSALVSLNDETGSEAHEDDNNACKRSSNKEAGGS